MRVREHARLVPAVALDCLSIQSNPELSNMSSLASQLALGTPVLASEAGITGSQPLSPVIFRGSGDWNSGPHRCAANALAISP